MITVVKTGRETGMEEDEPSRPRARLTPLPMDGMGVAELEAYIAELEAETARAKGAIERKQGHRSTAEAFFRKS